MTRRPITDRHAASRSFFRNPPRPPKGVASGWIKIPPKPRMPIYSTDLILSLSKDAPERAGNACAGGASFETPACAGSSGRGMWNTPPTF